jgi:hypothetical protein
MYAAGVSYVFFFLEFQVFSQDGNDLLQETAENLPNTGDLRKPAC